jgi:hypothetical protein
MNSKKTIVFACALLLVLITGCPEAPIKARKIVISFPIDNQASLTLTATDTEVRDALKLIDDVFVSNGFVREEKPPDVTNPGFLATYAKLDSEGRRNLGQIAWVYLETNLIEVAFPEGRQPTSAVRASVTNMLDLLKTKLKGQYGSDRIKAVEVKS